MRSICKEFPFALSTVEVIVNVFWQRLLFIATKIKLALRDDIVAIVAIVRYKGNLSNISSVGEYNVTGEDKRVGQSVGMFFCDEVVSLIIEEKPPKMVAANYGDTTRHKGLDLDVGTEGSHGNFFCKVFNRLYTPSLRDLAKFALYKLTICERLEVHEPKLENRLRHLL